MSGNTDFLTALKTERKHQWMEKLIADAWLEAQRLQRAGKQAEQFAMYRDDPVAFGVEVLHEYYTEDVKRVMYSVRDNMVTVAKSATEVGKSLPNFIRILTPEGYKPIGEIKIGDYAIGRNGYPTEIIGVFPQGSQPTYKITFSDESHILCSRDHLWLAISKSQKSRGSKWQFYTTDLLINHLKRQMHIPVCEPVFFCPKQYEISPYIMGVLLGDGSLTQTVEFTSADEWIVQRIASQLPNGVFIGKHKKKMSYRLKGRAGLPNPIKTIIENLGLLYHRSNDKFIPDIYMLGDIEQRKELLAGLLDTDGYITPNGSIIFTTVSHRLAEQVIELVNSLGGVAKIKSKKCAYKKEGVKIDCQVAYNLYLKIPFNPFTLPKKSARYKKGTVRKQPFRIIRDIEYVGEFESTCIRVASPEALYLTEHCIVTHNSHGAARIAVWFYRVFPDAKVYLTAAPPIENLKKILWGEIMSIVDKHAALFMDDKLKKDTIQRNPESFITCLTIPTTGTPEQREAKFSGKHAPHILFIVDEGDAVPDDIYKGIEGCLSGGIMPRLLIMFNPRVQQGLVYDKEVNRQANIVQLSALNHPNVITGKPFIPGAVMQSSVIRRINEWTRPLIQNEIETGGDIFTVPDFLIGKTAEAFDGSFYPPLQGGKRVVKEDGKAFYYMVIGEYPPQGESQLISKDWIEQARNRYELYVALNGNIPPAEVRPILGLDVSEMGGDWNVACLRYGGFVPPLTAWQGMDIDLSTQKALDMCKQHHVDIAMVDGMGVGSSVAPAMARRGKNDDVRAVSVKVSERPLPFIKTELGEFRSIRDQLWWACREWLKLDNTAMLPPDRMLIEELMSASYEIKLDGRIKITDKDRLRDILKRSPDRADALCLTFYPVRRAKVISVNYRG